MTAEGGQKILSASEPQVLSCSLQQSGDDLLQQCTFGHRRRSVYSVMTIVSSIRQIIDTPIHAITEGSSPVISYNYGARRPKRVFQSWLTMSVMAILYTLLAWGVILFAPRF